MAWSDLARGGERNGFRQAKYFVKRSLTKGVDLKVYERRLFVVVLMYVGLLELMQGAWN